MVGWIYFGGELLKVERKANRMQRGRGKQAVSRGGGANRVIVRGGVNRLLLEGEGQTGC